MRYLLTTLTLCLFALSACANTWVFVPTPAGGDGGGPTAWTNGDIPNATHDSTYNTPGITNPHGVAMNPDGTIGILVEFSGATMRQYSFGTGWDGTTGSNDSLSFSPTPSQSFGRGICHNSTGSKMYLVGSNPARVQEIITPSAYTLTSASDGGNFTLSGQPRGCAVVNGDSAFYTADETAQTLVKRTFGTAGDITTLSSATSGSISTFTSNVRGVWVSDDERYVAFADIVEDIIALAEMTTPGDVSTISYIGELSVASFESNVAGVSLDITGSYMVITGTSDDDFDFFTVPAFP